MVKKPSKTPRPLFVDAEAGFARPRLFERNRGLIFGALAFWAVVVALIGAVVLLGAYRLLSLL